LVHRDDHAEHSNCEASDEAAGDEHASVDSCRLDGASDDGSRGTELYRSLSPDSIRGLPSQQSAN
jgi:hypothetical protein